MSGDAGWPQGEALILGIYATVMAVDRSCAKQPPNPIDLPPLMHGTKGMPAERKEDGQRKK